MFKFLCLIAFFGVASAQETKTLDEWWKYAEIVPDVVDVSPKDDANITFRYNENVDQGTIFTTDQVAREPKIEWKATPNTLYTMMMVDPDAPSKKDPKLRSWRHLLVINVPGGGGATVDQGDYITDYAPPDPPIGRHRYVILVYKQRGKIAKVNVGQDDRASFNVKKFAKKYKLGNPIAGNYFRAYVDN